MKDAINVLMKARLEVDDNGPMKQSINQEVEKVESVEQVESDEQVQSVERVQSVEQVKHDMAELAQVLEVLKMEYTGVMIGEKILKAKVFDSNVSKFKEEIYKEKIIRFEVLKLPKI